MKYQFASPLPNMTVKNINVQNVSRPKNYSHSFCNGRIMHGFIYVVSGQMCDVFLAQREEPILINAGELIFIPKSTAYIGIYSLENTEIKIVQFDLASGSLPDFLSKPIKIPLPGIKELMASFFVPLEHQQSSSFYYLSCLYRLLWQVYESHSVFPTKFKRLNAALSEMNTHLDRKEPISYYAKLCNMSEVNFRRLFREYTGKSPVDYRNSVRMHAAKSKLQSGEYNVSEAAALCGFTNLSFFTRLYKKEFGCTPRQT